MSRSTVSRPTKVSRVWLLCLLALLAASFAPAGAPQALAQAAPDVRYDAIAKIVYVGANYTPGSLFAGYPSHPDAPKQPITVPALAQSLTAIGQPNLLVDQGGGAWLLRSDVVISPTARLEATAPSISALRLDSTPDRFPALTRLVATGGHLLIQGVSVVSWDNIAGAVDAEYLDGRSYLLAQTGGRLDIIDADVSYLGWGDGEPSGLAWRKRATKTDPKTGATGSMLRSNIHNNYFGQYSEEAYALQVLNNEIHDNVSYGLAPNNYSMNFVVAYNKIYNNGKHGISFSRGSESNWIHNNEVYGNLEHGIMLGRGSNNNKLSDNLIYNNRDGIAIREQGPRTINTDGHGEVTYINQNLQLTSNYVANNRGYQLALWWDNAFFGPHPSEEKLYPTNEEWKRRVQQISHLLYDPSKQKIEVQGNLFEATPAQKLILMGAPWRNRSRDQEACADLGANDYHHHVTNFEYPDDLGWIEAPRDVEEFLEKLKLPKVQ
mgnify:CR=1 FL=1